MSEPKMLPVLALRDIVVYPHMVAPLFVGRDKSMRALEEVMRGDKHIILVAQKDPATDDPGAGDLHETGTLAHILQMLKLPDGTMKVLAEGTDRVRVTNYADRHSHFEAQFEVIADVAAETPEALALVRTVAEQFENYSKLNRKIPPETVAAIVKVTEPSALADQVASHLAVKLGEKQSLLETASVPERLERVFALMENEISMLQVERKIRNRVKRQMEKTQREYYLNEQMKAIQRELGESEEGKDEFSEIEARIRRTRLSKEARTKCEAELRKLRQMAGAAAEAQVVRNYLDWMLSLPWGPKKRIRRDIVAAEEVLEADHFGLEKVKERIIEYLAVQARTTKLRGPIMCLIGPPGVGKTSLARSIAKATGREFIRVSLGGLHDEAEIRGHRRTYLGSMPGRIIQNMKKAKSTNPLVLLDEIDKMGRDYRGDPAAALLEVLDPEQNANFIDNYLEVGYDLSDVMFLATANSMNLSQPLLDRMELIRIPGYTEQEKLEIAKRHLVPKQLQEHALKPDEITLGEEAIVDIIRYYTREAGVRNLEREIANVARKAVRAIEQKKTAHAVVTSANLSDYCGIRKYRYGEAETEDQVGAVTGLAWTEAGGDTLTIEAISMPGKGGMTVTGNLREVMKESISAANSYVRSRAIQFGIKPTLFPKTDIHVHVPEGAVPKDGPSAGIAMVTAIVSLLTGVTVRRDVAMTGEVTLRGRVLPIGGLKEKLLAAVRAGIKTVLIPKDNEKDLADVPNNVKSSLTIIPVSLVDEVLAHALTGPLTPIAWQAEDDEAAEKAKAAELQKNGDSEALLPH